MAAMALPPGNLSEAVAVLIGHVHLGPCRDQLLDHRVVAQQRCQMQRSAALVLRTPCHHGLLQRL